MKKHSIAILFLLFNFFNGCSLFEDDEKEKTIYGVWYADRGNAGYKITTDESVRAVDPFKSNGEIKISGDFNNKLYYIYLVVLGEDHNYLRIHNWFESVSQGQFYFMVIDLGQTSDNVTVYIQDQIDSYSVGGTIEYLFDGEILSISNQTISQNNINITLDGTISLEYVNLIANEPYYFYYPSESYFNRPTTLNIAEDKPVNWNQERRYDGTLNTTENTIEVEKMWGYDEIIWNYELLDNGLNLSTERNACNDPGYDCISTLFNVKEQMLLDAQFVDNRSFRAAG